MTQEAPFAVQVELTEGCNLRCSYCGLSGIREKGKLDLKFLSLAEADALAANIAAAGWNPRVEFAMHGEPTLNPHHVAIFAAFRKHLPGAYLLIETNGGGIFPKKDRIAHLLGMLEHLDCVGLDQYQGVPLIPAIWEDVAAQWDRFVDAGVAVHEYPKDPDGNPHQRSRKKRLVRIAPIDTATKGTHATLNNHTGAGAPLDFGKQGKRCAKPFREMSIRWDGSVALCCNDWRGKYKCGNALLDSVETIWNNAYFDAARRRLMQGDRSFGPCHGCNATSYRTGLLPDKKGKVAMPLPDKASETALAEALAGKPYTAPVVREWEK